MPALSGSISPRMDLRSLAVLTIAASSLWLFGGNPLTVYKKLFVPGALSTPADLYHPWYGSRELLLRGRDPYSPAVTREIRSAYAGVEQRDPLWGQFAYPAYVAFLMAPTLTMSFGNVKVLFILLLAVATAISVPLWLRTIGWRLSIWVTVVLTLALVASPAVVQGLELQQLGLMVAALISLSMYFLVRRAFFSAGAVLALASIKPQMIVLLAPWLLLWAISGWNKRKLFVFGFIGVLISLTVGALILLPSWITEWVQAVIAYQNYGGYSLMGTLLGAKLGSIAAVLVLLSLSFSLIRLRTALEDSTEFALAVAGILLLELLIAPLMAGYNQVLMVPALLLLLKRVSNLFASRTLVQPLV